jgi:hypothetical protein
MTATTKTTKTAARKPAHSAEFLAEAGAVLSEIAADAAKQAAAKKTPAKTAKAAQPAAKKTAPTKVAPAKAKTEKKTFPQPQGFPIGLVVVSSKDGQTYTVCGPDKSSLYVAVKSAEGKRLIRSIKTLTPVKTAARKTAAKKTAAAK